MFHLRIQACFIRIITSGLHPQQLQAPGFYLEQQVRLPLRERDGSSTAIQLAQQVQRQLVLPVCSATRH